MYVLAPACICESRGLVTVSKKCLLLLPFWCWVTLLKSLSASSLVSQHHTRL